MHILRIFIWTLILSISRTLTTIHPTQACRSQITDRTALGFEFLDVTRHSAHRYQYLHHIHRTRICVRSAEMTQTSESGCNWLSLARVHECEREVAREFIVMLLVFSAATATKKKAKMLVSSHGHELAALSQPSTLPLQICTSALNLRSTRVQVHKYASPNRYPYLPLPLPLL